jgi:pimeloyl-CoA synthetase
MNYERLSEFNRDFKKLLKKFRTLESDFEILKKAHIELLHVHGIKSDDPVPIEGYCTDGLWSYKVRKFACKALKNRGNKTGIRVIYVYDENDTKITFVEIYFKADKENEDRERLQTFLAQRLMEKAQK